MQIIDTFSNAGKAALQAYYLTIYDDTTRLRKDLFQIYDESLKEYVFSIRYVISNGEQIEIISGLFKLIKRDMYSTDAREITSLCQYLIDHSDVRKELLGSQLIIITAGHWRIEIDSDGIRTEKCN